MFWIESNVVSVVRVSLQGEAETSEQAFLELSRTANSPSRDEEITSGQ